jgi:hypothetical protein
MTDDERPMDPAPEDESPEQSSGDQEVKDFKQEIEEDPSVNPPADVDRLRGG